MNRRWTKSNTAVYNVAFHLIWCPKYRRKCLVGGIETRLKELLISTATDMGISIEIMEIMPDHVHIFVKSHPVDSPQWIVKKFKGISSRILRKEFPILLKMPTLWTRSYYCESVGHISEKTIRKYIEEQKNK